jgi:hypothetical protein
MTHGREGGRLAAAVFAAALVALLSGVASPASAASYANGEDHYGFSYPDGWSEEPNTNVDVAILGPSDGGFRANIVGQHEAEPEAQNTKEWLFNYVSNSFAAIKGRMNVTEVQGARTFTSASGRIAADFVFDRASGGISLRQRQVFFVSAVHHLTYFLTLTDKSSTFDTHSGDWARAVDSFAVSGESELTGLLPYIAVAAAGVGGAGAVLVVRRRRARSRTAAPAATKQ